MKRFITLSLLLGLVSLMSACGPSYPNCENDDNCKEHNEYCVNGKCKQCAMDSQCNAMDKCLVCGPTGSCITQSGCCHSDLDCPGGKCWKDEGSDIGQCGGQCRGANDCPAGLECRGGQCVKPYEAPPEACAKPVYFDFNEAVLTKDAQKQLKANVDCHKKENVNVQVQGHCDERGTEEYNLALGNRRASVAMKFLVNAGVNKKLLKTVSFGEERPACYEHEESCWWKNRRAEFVNQ